MGLTLDVESLSVARGGRVVTQPMSFALRGGRITTLVGPNGAGKSTLLEALTGVVREVTGKVTIEGHGDLAKLSPLARARLVGWAPTAVDPAFGFTAAETVVLGRFPWHTGRPRKVDRDRAYDALERMGVGALADRSIQTLSSGERQKVMLARVLAGDAAILLFDEPLANLDVAAGFAFQRLLADLTPNKTICYTVHDLGAAWRFGDDALVLKDGVLAAAGPVEASLGRATIRAVFGVDAEVTRLSTDDDALVLLP